MTFGAVAAVGRLGDGWQLSVCASGDVTAEDLSTLDEVAARCATHGEGARLLIAVSGPAETEGSLRDALGTHAAAWPSESWSGSRIVIARADESILGAEVAAEAARTDEPRDVVALRLLAQALFRLDLDGALARILDDGVAPLGRGDETALRSAVPSVLVPPRLRNDCFAMPQGVDWIPVDDAIARLRGSLRPLTGVERVPVARGLGRVLAADCVARRSNPPAANSAVDGYGFAHAATGSGPQHLPLVEGRAAAGQPYPAEVPPGAAIRILTGAILPAGVDTVVLEEDTATDGATVAFDGPVRAGANTRKAGENVAQGASVVAAGSVLRPQDLALLTAVGIEEIAVWRRLRVAVLSTGDELSDGAEALADPHRIPDANRPMLLALAERWGYQTVDLGHAPDDSGVIAQRLDRGASEADVILTSGGASAGDEDHVSRLLSERGDLSSWRIAVKPGRPLALALWNGTPVFGLPGNPVAAFVCALVFGRPALAEMAGAGWVEPFAVTVPAAFEKSKKPGRREYLRARLTPDGTAEVFKSEGSGRISGLSWATGLVELPDGAADIRPGTPVRYLPFSGFGL